MVYRVEYHATLKLQSQERVDSVTFSSRWTAVTPRRLLFFKNDLGVANHKDRKNILKLIFSIHKYKIFQYLDFKLFIALLKKGITYNNTVLNIKFEFHMSRLVKKCVILGNLRVTWRPMTITSTV